MACDGSGYIINAVTDNGDGTFTINLTILVAGFDHPGGTFGGTTGFFFGTDAAGGIVSVSPPSLTSSNGTTLNAVITGGQVNWGDPNSGPFFVDSAVDPTENLNVTIVVSGEPSSWFGGGMEGGACTPSSNDGQAGEYSGCFPPSIEVLPVGGPFCAGEPINISALVSGGNVTVTWSNGMVGTDIVFTPTETTTLIATANNGCDPATDAIVIPVLPQPEMDPIPPVQACEGQPVELIAVTENTGPVTWSNGLAGNVIVVEADFTQTITATASNQCGTVSQDVQLTVTPLPLLFILSDPPEVCPGESVELEADVEFETSFSWSTGATTETITITPPASGIIVASATNQCGTVTDQIDVTVNDLPEINDITPEQFICQGEEANLLVNTSDADNIFWSNGTNGSINSVTPDSTQNYEVIAINLCGADTADVTVNVNTLPDLTTVMGTQDICEGDQATLEVQVDNEDNFAWSTGDTTNSITVMPAVTDTFSVSATNECGTVDTAFAINVLALPDYSIINGAQDICEGDTLVLSISPNVGNDVLWSTGAVDTAIVVTPTTDTSFTVDVSNICGQLDTVFDIGVTPLTDLELVDAGNAICDNDSTSLSVSVANQDDFSWNTGETTTDITVAPDTTTTYTATASNSCNTEEIAITVEVSPTYITDLPITICPDETFEYEGVTMLPGDSQSFTLSSLQGCDSTVNVSVTAFPSYEDSLTLQACTGTTVSYNGNTLNPGTVQTFNFNTINGCDSIITVTVEEVPVLTSSLTLETCPGTTVGYESASLSPGDVQDFTFISSNGCDSIVTVTVNALPTFSSAVQLQTCTGTTIAYDGVPLSPGDVQDFTLVAQNGCDSVVTVSVAELLPTASTVTLQACDNETASYNGNSLAPGSTQDFVFTNEVGCDSTVTVIVESLPTFTSVEVLETCPGTTVNYNGTDLSPGDMQDFTLQAVNGCDSVVTVMVNALPTFASTLILEACPDATASYNGSVLNPGDTTDFTLQAINGCDSVVTVIVEELPTFSSTLMLQSCENETVDYLGNTLNPGDTTDFTFSALNGCDSVVTVIVETLPTFTSTLELTACENETAEYLGTTLSPGDTMDFTLAALNGCDSVVTVFVTPLPTFASVQPLTACPGTTVEYNGTTLNPGETMDFTLTALNGCDSVVTVVVEELPTFESDLTLQACTGFTVSYNGVELAPGDEQSFTLQAQNGCDSVVNITVEEVVTLTSSLTLRACPGNSVNYDGTSLLAGETQDFTFTSVSGCDSIVTVFVDPYPVYEEDLELMACSNETVTYNGTVLNPGAVQSFTLSTVQGCDSIINVTVVELPTYEQDLQLEACPGTTVTYNGTVLNPGANQSFTLQAVNGCDSVINVSVLELPTFESDLTLQTCLGESTTYNGTTLEAGDQQSFTLVAQNGCDSIVNVTVEGIDVFETDLMLQACSGTTVDYNGTTLNAGESQVFTFVSQIGCDSFVTVMVEELEVFEQQLELQTCEGTTIQYAGATLSPGDQQSFTLTAQNGCDSVVNVSVVGLEVLFTDETRTICQGDSSVIFGDAEFLSGTYSQTFTSVQGCDSTHTVELVVTPLPQPNVEVQDGCPDEGNGIASLNASGSQAPYSFAWADGVSTADRFDLGAGEYDVTVTDNQGCENTLSFSVGERSLSYEVLTEDISCFGAGDGLIQVNAQGSGLTYSIDGETFSSSSAFLNLEAGNYTVVVEDAFGCQFEAPGQVVNEPDELIVQLPPNADINIGDSVLVNAIVNTADSVTYTWSPLDILSCSDCSAPYARPFESTFVTVSVVTENNCRAEDRMQIIVRKDRNVYIPNVFSPNGDGSNDVFYIFSDPTVANIKTFKIFNRWGEPVFEAFDLAPNDPNNGWDGTYRGELMNGAVFTYYAEIEFIDGVEELFQGDVILMR
jgi:gliding motility-associated-like protein